VNAPSARGNARGRSVTGKGKKRAVPERKESHTPTTPTFDDDTATIPGDDDDGASTEPMDDPMEVDMPALRKPAPSRSSRINTRKTPLQTERKASAKSKSKITPHAVTAASSLASTVLSVHGQGDRLPELSTARKRGETANSSVPLAARVFAYWKGNRSYYSGTVKTLQDGSYEVFFDDGHFDFLEIRHLRQFSLRKGDLVHVPAASGSSSLGGQVLEILDNDGNLSVVVTYKNKRTKKEETLRHPLKHVKITEANVLLAWNDRLLQPGDIEPLETVELDSLASPSLRRSPSKRSTLTHSGISGDMWAGYGFVTTGVSSQLQDAIQADEGTIVEEGWTAIYALHGQLRQSGAWVARSEQMRYSFNKDMQRVFLLAEQPHQTPKYLMALALGIPCVSIEWITDSRRRGVGALILSCSCWYK
jgi:hypothetical protein